jgi:hypothetical protein
MNETILLENRAYWTQRAPSYSQVNREELAADHREVWKQTLIERITEGIRQLPAQPSKNDITNFVVTIFNAVQNGNKQLPEKVGEGQ